MEVVEVEVMEVAMEEDTEEDMEVVTEEITVGADASMEVVEVVMRDPHPNPVVDTNVVVDAEEVAVVEEVVIAAVSQPVNLRAQQEVLTCRSEDPYLIVVQVLVAVLLVEVAMGTERNKCDVTTSSRSLRQTRASLIT